MKFHFDEYGSPVPPEVVSLSEAELSGSFAAMDDVEARAPIYDGYTSYVMEFQEDVAPDRWKQWIGGSYTTTKKVPGDIDLVNFTESNPKCVDAIERRFLTRSKPCSSKDSFRVDGYWVPVYPEEDPRYAAVTQYWTDYWRKVFGKDRNGRPRAIFEVVMS